MYAFNLVTFFRPRCNPAKLCGLGFLWCALASSFFTVLPDIVNCEKNITYGLGHINNIVSAREETKVGYMPDVSLFRYVV